MMRAVVGHVCRHTTASLVMLALALGVSAATAQAPPARRAVIVASKPFGESYLLAEMFAQLLERTGRVVDRKPGLGATEVAFSAIRTGAIDVYPEYVGTGLVAILGDSVTAAMRADARVAFAHVATATRERFGVHWLPPLGFQNGYAIAVRRETAERWRLRTLGDLGTTRARLVAGFTSDFIGRSDGWAGLRAHYGITLGEIRPLAPALKYVALNAREVDIIDGYATDGLLAKYDLVTLADDRAFFPPYAAAALVSDRLMRADPGAVSALATLSGRLSETLMRDGNRAIEVEHRAVAEVAREILARAGLADSVVPPTTRTGKQVATRGLLDVMVARRDATLRLAAAHLQLVILALLAAIAVAVPLAVSVADRPHVAAAILQTFGIVQTIPGLALLALMVPLLGIGTQPAFAALFIYALLPIARATITGLNVSDRDAANAVEAMGATRWQTLRWVRLPLAAPVVVSGIRTAAVLTVGTATLAAFIGGGGLGEPIVTGLALADMNLVLSGAIPAAVLAVLVDLLLGALERFVTPPHLRRARPSR